MFRQTVDREQPSEALQKLEAAFLQHQSKMQKIMRYLEFSKPQNQSEPVQYHRFSGANPLLPPFEKISQRWQNFYRQGCVTGLEDEYAERMRYTIGYKGPEQNYLEKLISNYYQTLGISGDVMISDTVIDSFLLDLCRLLLNRGDVVLSSSPIYGVFFNLLVTLQTYLYLINTNEEMGFKFTPALLTEMLQTVDNAKIFLFVHPDNPSGVFYSKDELAAIADVFISFNQERKRLKQPLLIVIVDEVICNLIYSQTDYTHLASFAAMQEFTMTMTSLSKDQSPEYAFAILIGPREILQNLKQPQGGIENGKLISIAQLFLPENKDALKVHYQKSMMVYQTNLSLLKTQIELFNSKFQFANIGVRLVNEPKAGFQVLLQINGLTGTPYPEDYKLADYVSKDGIYNSLDFAAYFRDTYKVELVPGEGFNFEGNLMMFRMSISKTPRQIKNFFKYLVDAVLSLKPFLPLELSITEVYKDDPAENRLIDYRYLARARMKFTTATRNDYFEEVSPDEEKVVARRVSLG
jgi:aspartate/methionine/tyrosine aminotransferase